MNPSYYSSPLTYHHFAHFRLPRQQVNVSSIFIVVLLCLIVIVVGAVGITMFKKKQLITQQLLYN